MLYTSPLQPSLSHSVCLSWDVKGALSLLFICMYCRGLEAEESQTGSVKSLQCAPIYLNHVSVPLNPNLCLWHTPSLNLCSCSVALIITHHYMSNFERCNLLTGSNLLCLLQHLLSLLLYVCSPCSLLYFVFVRSPPWGVLLKEVHCWPYRAGTSDEGRQNWKSP